MTTMNHKQKFYRTNEKLYDTHEFFIQIKKTIHAYTIQIKVCSVWYAKRYCPTDDNRPKLTPRVPRLSHELKFILIAYFYQRLKKNKFLTW